MRRFSIAGLMVVVLVCGLAVAALRYATITWYGAVLMVTLSLLGTAVLAAIERRGTSRSFWRGFAIFGWGYLTLAIGPWFEYKVGNRLPVMLLLGYAFEQTASTNLMPASPAPPGGWTSLPVPTTPQPEYFLKIGQCLFALLCGVLGGYLAVRFRQGRPPATEE